jgi:hypothetical protein
MALMLVLHLTAIETRSGLSRRAIDEHKLANKRPIKKGMATQQRRNSNLETKPSSVPGAQEEGNDNQYNPVPVAAHLEGR